MPEDLEPLLQSWGARFVRVTWCDNANVIRAKAFHVQMLEHYRGNGVGLTAAQQALPVMYDAVVPETGLSPVGEVRLVPDWATLTPLPYAPGHARVLGDMMLGGRPWPLCPRDCLKRQLADAAADGLQVMAAFENEFFLLRPDEDHLRPADDTVFAATLAMDRGHAVIGDVVAALDAQGIPVEIYYPEAGPGQHEIACRYTNALTAADRQLAFRETVHAVAYRHGLRATFLPKVFADKAGSGCHVHLSLWRGGVNLFPDAAGRHGLSDVARSAIAGLLHHLPALAAVTLPTRNSYRRIRPHFWSGAFRCWGLDNREAAVRVPTDPAAAGPTQLELKSLDATANPHLALAAVVAAALDGVRRRLDPGDPVNLDPGNLAEEERQARGIDPLPASPAEACDRLERDEVVMNALGPELARAFVAVRRAEWEAMQGLELNEEVKLLLERY